jgi:hypothetical protein
VVIYDYVDENEPLLAKMTSKREVGYTAITRADTVGFDLKALFGGRM